VLTLSCFVQISVALPPPYTADTVNECNILHLATTLQDTYILLFLAVVMLCLHADLCGAAAPLHCETVNKGAQSFFDISS
jgi:hypothetical protein